MAEVKIPKDKDEILKLAREVLKKNPVAAKKTKVKPPAKVLKQIRININKADKSLKTARDLRKKAESFQKNTDKLITSIEKALRNASQILKRQLENPKDLGLWGYTVDEGLPKKAQKKVAQAPSPQKDELTASSQEE